MKTNHKIILVTAVLATATATLDAMPGAAHDRLGKKILSEPPPLGARGLKPEKVEIINRWMDNPATKIGEYKNRIADALVHPNNHGLLRHNPDAVSRVMTGTGGIDPAHKNIARVHKIADVAANSAPVDGWLPKTLRQEAKQLVSHINEEGHLPKKLPTWVDSSGPLLKKTAAPAAKGVTKAAPAVGLAVETGVRGFGAFKTEQQYHQGRIDKRERGARHAENAGGLVGGVGGAGAGALGGAAIGAPFAGVGAVPGATIGGILGGVGGGVAGDYVGSKSGRVLYEGFTR